MFPISAVYYAVAGLRNVFYDIRILKSHRISKTKVIAVGNISVGGTGKTPLVQHLAKFLHSQGKKVATLSRGYKRTTKGYILAKDYQRIYEVGDTIGDEPTQYVHNLPFAAVAVAEKRVVGANELVKSLSPDVILLDDAFQHRAIERDVNIVVLDYHSPPWQDFVLPVGNLREPFVSIERADIVVLNKVKYENTVQKKIADFTRYIHAIKPNLPVFISSYQPKSLISISEEREISLDSIYRKRIFAICGIGNPDYFITQLELLGADIPTILTLKDHRSFDEEIIKTIQNEVKALNPDYVICTEKDFYRFRYASAYQHLREINNFYYLMVELVFWGQDGDYLQAKIMEKV